MHEVGQNMPVSLRETGIGGLAGTPTGERIKKEIFGYSQRMEGISE